MDPTEDLMLAPDASDPNAFLQEMLALASSTQASKAPPAGFPQQRVLAPPRGLPPTAQLPTPTPPDQQTGGGTDWRGLLQLIAPAIGSLVAGGGHQMPAFWSAYLERQAGMQQDAERKKTQQENKNKAAAEFLMNTEQDAEKYDDPVLLAQHLQAADEAGALAGFTKPGDLKNKYTVSPNKLAQKKLDELNALLDGAEKGGYNLDDLATSGAVLTTKDGSRVPVTTALDLTRKRPLDANGKPVAKPAKVGNNEEERFLEKFAKDNGYTSADKLPASLELQGRKLFREAGRADKTYDPASPAAQYADLVELWKTSHNGQDPPASVRTQLRKQANTVNDKPTVLSGMNGLYDKADPQAIADMIMRGDREPDTANLGRPISGAVDSILANAGYNKAKAITDWKATQHFMATLNGAQQTRLRQATETAYHSLDVIDELSAKWQGGRYPLLNKATLALAKGGTLGADAQSIATQLEAQINDLTSELGNVYMGGNSPTDHALQLASKNLSSSWSAATLKDMTQLARTNLKIRLNSMSTVGVAGVPNNPYLPPTPTPKGDPLGLFEKK